jgi:hypothetical protein
MPHTISIARLKNFALGLVFCTLSANVLDNGWYVNILCQTSLPRDTFSPLQKNPRATESLLP